MTSNNTGSSASAAEDSKQNDNDELSYRELTDLIYAPKGKPCGSRSEAVQAMRVLMGRRDRNATEDTMDTDDASLIQQQPDDLQRPPLVNLNGMGPLLLSDIPASARQPGVCVGIDEAGRGSVLGPMIYGAAFWNTNATTIPKGFDDSKQLTDGVRSGLLEQLLACPDIGWSTRILHASEISRNMLRRGTPYNLNQMSHDAAIAMIRAIHEAGVNIQTCFIDTVGKPEPYKRRLEREFPGMDFVVESKADSNYATCSAASVVAKVLRDRMMEHWQFSEPLLNNSTNTEQHISSEWGSGYPSDPKCKAWMQNNLNDPVFGWPDVVRFSWGPAKKSLVKDAAPVQFEADDDEDDGNMDAYALAGKKRQQANMSAFLAKGKKNKNKQPPRLPYFERNNLQVVPHNVF